MQKLTDEYSLDDWRRLEPDTTYAMVAAHERIREEQHQEEIERLRAQLADAAAQLDSIMERRDGQLVGAAWGDVDNVRLDLLQAAAAAGWGDDA